MRATFLKHILEFRKPGGTSRGILYNKPSWYIRIEDENGKVGIGECSLIPDLSIEPVDQIENQLKKVCDSIDDYQINYHDLLREWPSVRFALEMALKGLESYNPYVLYPSSFTSGSDSININGLIWMGGLGEMHQQIEQKLEQGYSCLKLKIGALDFDTELNVLKNIRSRFSRKDLELRVDANGAFAVSEAPKKLLALSKYDLHSIEQPIMAGQLQAMAELCSSSPVPIALDEELIGVNQNALKGELLNAIKPQFIILKPSLLGGFMASEEWIGHAKKNNVDWWITSALEGNIGLNAISQWTYTLNNKMPQGLGTGQVYTNNVQSPLYLQGDALFYKPEAEWMDPFNV